MPRFISDEEMAVLEASEKPKKRFISDDEMAALEAADQRVTSPKGLVSPEGAEAAIQGFGQASTFGLLPALQAMAQPVTDRAFNLARKVGSLGKSENVEPAPLRQMIPGSPEYVAVRDEMIAREKRLGKESPLAFGLGQTAGLIGGAALPMKALGLAGKAATTATGRIGQAALGGATQSVLQTPEAQPGEAPSLRLQERAENALTGGLIGGAAEGALMGLGKGYRAIKGAGSSAEKIANELALKQIGAQKPDIKKLTKRDAVGEFGEKIQKIGRFARDEKLVTPGGTTADVLVKTEKYLEDVGSKIGQIYDDALAASKVSVLGKAGEPKLVPPVLSPANIADEIVAKTKKQFKARPDGSKAISSVESVMQNFKELGDDADILAVNKFRQQLDDIIFDKDTNTIQRQALKDVRAMLKGKVDENIRAMETTAGKDLIAPLKELNEKYSLASDIKTVARNKMSGELGNNILSLTDKMFVMGGAATGVLTANDPETAVKNALIGGSLGLLSKGARKVGAGALMGATSAFGKAADELAQVLEISGQKITPEIVSKMNKKYGAAFTQSVLNHPSLRGYVASGLLNKPTEE